VGIRSARRPIALAVSLDGRLLAGRAWSEVMPYDATPLPGKPWPNTFRSELPKLSGLSAGC
jgi:hypothetical protein